MAKKKKGDMHIAVCLFHEDFVGLANDRVWREYTELVG